MTSEKKHSVLSAVDLSIGYFSKKKTAVIARDINFSFSEGSLVSLIGANGIGKSTLLRTLSGMQQPLSGSVQIQAIDLSDYNSLALAGVLSVVLTEAPSSKNLSVLEFVSLGRQPHTSWMGKLSEVDKEKVQWAMAQTDVSELKQRKCYELSDGQLQRVAIARALAQDTPLIILDEPTTHLDLYHRASVLKLLKKLALETNKTILFSTHEIDLALQLADEMILMTPRETLVDSPQKLIVDGHFNDLFPADTVVFDATTGRFTIKN